MQFRYGLARLPTQQDFDTAILLYCGERIVRRHIDQHVFSGNHVLKRTAGPKVVRFVGRQKSLMQRRNRRLLRQSKGVQARSTWLPIEKSEISVVASSALSYATGSTSAKKSSRSAVGRSLNAGCQGQPLISNVVQRVERRPVPRTVRAARETMWAVDTDRFSRSRRHRQRRGTVRAVDQPEIGQVLPAIDLFPIEQETLSWNWFGWCRSLYHSGVW